MLELVSSWALGASVHPLLLITTASIAILGCSMAIFNARVLLKQKRQQELVNRRLHEDMASLSKSAIGMGQKVLETERRLAEVLKKQFAILNSQPEHPSYDQASRLIAMGATENDLVSSCGFSHSEAELLLSLNRKRQGNFESAVH
ncbi:DUF2802 domain-containing protein [Bermanella sp. WJH001]|uniref:DUF2802 domain-containing protein n=1 Tax=Bermanella sp. WJH001 TaxID=3048005 RepID=UPI0024BDCA80|nr:DUF2802 domain-containing protein [Bermanella sp. WJH001]MDJ1539850.1 DUF2802 domain-containing protein [Bermanella sp. WJH001]